MHRYRCHAVTISNLDIFIILLLKSDQQYPESLNAILVSIFVNKYKYKYVRFKSICSTLFLLKVQTTYSSKNYKIINLLILTQDRFHFIMGHHKLVQCTLKMAVVVE